MFLCSCLCRRRRVVHVKERRTTFADARSSTRAAVALKQMLPSHLCDTPPPLTSHTSIAYDSAAGWGLTKFKDGTDFPLGPQRGPLGV